MNKEKISIAIGELADRHIQEALDYEKRIMFLFVIWQCLKKLLPVLYL